MALSMAPFHILSYGTMLGTTFFHTFVNAIISFRALERPQFAALQDQIFPVYFGMQTALPVLIALTYPASRNPFGAPASLRGVLDGANRWTVLAPLATMFVAGAANLAVLLPRVKAVKAERGRQEREDGKKSYEPPPHSEEMLGLNKRFGQLHGVSSLLNLTTFVAAVVYGVTLSSRLD